MRFFMRRNPQRHELDEVRQRIAAVEDQIKRIQESTQPSRPEDSAEAYRSVFQVRTAMALEELIQKRAELAQLREREAELLAAIPEEELLQAEAPAPSVPPAGPPLGERVMPAPLPPQPAVIVDDIAPPEPPADVSPPLPPEEPPAPVEEPIADVEEATIAVEEAPVAVEEPTVAVEEPTVAVEEPVAAVEEPTAEVEEPLVAVEEPGLEAVEPEPPAAEAAVVLEAPVAVEPSIPIETVSAERAVVAGQPEREETSRRARIGAFVLGVGVLFIAGGVIGGFLSGVIRLGGDPSARPTVPAVAVAPTNSPTTAPTAVPPTAPPPTATREPTAVPQPTEVPTAVPQPTEVPPTAEPRPTAPPEPTPEPAQVATAVPEPEPSQREAAIGTAVVGAPAGFSSVILRAAPTSSARSLRTLSNGTRLEVLPGAARADGFRWVRVRTGDGLEGWVVAVAVGR